MACDIAGGAIIAAAKADIRGPLVRAHVTPDVGPNCQRQQLCGKPDAALGPPRPCVTDAAFLASPLV